MRSVQETSTCREPVATGSGKFALLSTESITMDPFEERKIRVRRQRSTTSPEELPRGETWWVSGSIPEVWDGPVISDQKEVYIHYRNGTYPVDIREGEHLADLGEVPETERLKVVMCDAAAEVCKQAVEDIFGSKGRVDEYTDCWLGPSEFGAVLGMLENSKGGATVPMEQIVGIMMHQKSRRRLYVPSQEGAGARCRDAKVRISMQHFTNGDRKVMWDFTPQSPGKDVSDEGWIGYTLFLTNAPEPEGV